MDANVSCLTLRVLKFSINIKKKLATICIEKKGVCVCVCLCVNMYVYVYVCESKRLQKQLVKEVASLVREPGPGVDRRLIATFYNFFFNMKM